jgi:tetratricopeptide (TPR) repeat protein
VVKKTNHRITESRNHRRLNRAVFVFQCFCVSVFVVSGCAPKAPPVAPGSPKHPEFVFPAVAAGVAPEVRGQIERGWQYLQFDDYRNAEREFTSALKQQTASAPAETAMAYLQVARGNEKDAVTRFDRALQIEATYVPALIGRGQVLLELERDADALASFEAALAKDPSLTDLRSRIDVLKIRATQAMLARAKAAADARRWDDAAAIYRQAIAASPDSGFLYRDLAAVEQRAGQTENALEHYRKAVDIDATDARSLAGIGAILEAQGDVVGALAALERAKALDDGEVPESALARLRGAAALAKLPAEYRSIPTSTTVTRGDIAALIGVRLETLLARAQPRQAIVTDIRGHWAQPWIAPVVRAGVMDPLPNYEFEPSRLVRRNELATTVSRLLTLIAASKPELANKWRGAQVSINDVATTHLSYPAVSAAVAAGVMGLSNGDFDLLRGVTGAEAADIISRLEALAAP